MSKPDNETTLVDLFRRRVDRSWGNPALLIKRGGQFCAVTWNQLRDDVDRFAAALVSLGVEPGDRVAQLSENRYEWIAADLAIMSAGGVHVPIHASLTGPQVAFQIRDSGCRVALVSTAAQAEKLSRVAAELPQDVAFVSYDRVDVSIGGAFVQTLAEAEACDVEGLLAANVDLFSGAIRSPDSLATILYTSGTTGEPKGVCLTHRNLVSNALATLAMFRQEESDVRINFLPLSHIFARTCDLYIWIASGSQLGLAESRDTVIADCQALRPTHLSAVPYFFDKLYRGLSDAGQAETPGAVRQMLGGAMRMLTSGGAALPDYLFDFFEKQELPIYQGYGLSETSPVITVSSPAANRRGSAGKPIAQVELRIADDGEILTRGPHVMRGYWRNDAATREILDKDGWLRTGDFGQIDDDGFLFITGRKKELIVTAAGKNVAPILLESLLTEDPLILQAIVVGDDRSYLTALLVPDPDQLQVALAACDISTASPEETLRHPEVRSLFANRIEQRLAKLSHYEQVRKFTLLPRAFTIESGEMTPKLSLRRKEIEANFADVIEAMYAKE
ncbi:MAG: long-chain fatty acid--CoA ligase [Planctomycetales bacterium]|nr:long-chain fatty acid--CoA ligase [Planctomycetales bacterium]